MIYYYKSIFSGRFAMILKEKKNLIKKALDDPQAKNIDFYPVITANDGAPGFAMRLFEIGADGHTPFHAHDWEHEVYIIEGTGFLVEENKKTEIKKSDFLYISPGEKHQFQAGKTGMKMICVVPNKGQPL